MTIDTTINLNKKYLRRLVVLGEKYSLSRSKLIALVVKKFLQEKRLSCVMFKGVTYQQRCKKNCWKVVHVCFVVDLFERCCDVRKFSKISVSLLVAMSIELYLDVIEKELERGQEDPNITDNYHHNYVCLASNDQGNENFHVYWDMPAEKELKKYLGSTKNAS